MVNFNPTAGVPRAWATHGGEDVPVFAVGPLASALFSGSVDQSYIPHAIAYAACLAHHASRCSRDPTNNANASDTMNAAPISCPSAEPNSAAISSDNLFGIKGISFEKQLYRRIILNWTRERSNYNAGEMIFHKIYFAPSG
ncbi:Uncharacterized protein DBV15_09710 [Temnothorax longispinosus]|uniref:alkaline phosphatase n=1 Tax=Temnothorax longispinosus TaxID=300112 RepID=A0A4S2L5R9_9HYME|nr:Uncharacterized protein DBV15_09710 [Temnothorax longispinosus]